MPLEPSYVVGHVASAPKEQNLATLFNDGESSQVWFYVTTKLRNLTPLLNLIYSAAQTGGGGVTSISCFVASVSV